MSTYVHFCAYVENNSINISLNEKCFEQNIRQKWTLYLVSHIFCRKSLEIGNNYDWTASCKEICNDVSQWIPEYISFMVSPCFKYIILQTFTFWAGEDGSLPRDPDRDYSWPNRSCHLIHSLRPFNHRSGCVKFGIRFHTLSNFIPLKLSV
jgi:hypothetical protein